MLLEVLLDWPVSDKALEKGVFLLNLQNKSVWKNHMINKIHLLTDTSDLHHVLTGPRGFKFELHSGSIVSDI